MGYSYKAIVNKNNRFNKTGLHSIYIRITVDGRYKDLKTGEKIHTNFWNGKENKWVKDSCPFAFELNALIRKKIYSLQQFEFKQKLFGNGISLKSLVDHYNKKSDTNLFNDYVTEFIKSVKGKSLNTLKKYKTFERYLNEFNSKIQFSQLNEPLFQSFARWLQDKKHLIGVTVYKYFDPFKVICKQAVKDGYLEKEKNTCSESNTG